METQCEQEVRGFHAFLRDWLVGAVPRTAETFARFSGALVDEVEVVSPLGTVTGRDALVSEFEGLHGRLAADADAFEIWIENYRCRTGSWAGTRRSPTRNGTGAGARHRHASPRPSSAA